MSGSLPRIAVRCLALAVLVLLACVLVGAPATAQHRHDGPGLYNPDCPLAALAAVDRLSSVVVAVTSTPLLSATGLLAVSLVGCPAAAPAADVRLRAPPTR